MLKRPMERRASPPLVPFYGGAIICPQSDIAISRNDRRDILFGKRCDAFNSDFEDFPTQFPFG